jgi:hypothetical protein
MWESAALGAMSAFRQNPQTASRVIDRVAFVVTTHGNKLHTLNRVGTHIWELLAEPREIEDIGRAVEEQFEVDATSARADAERFCAKLVSLGLLEAL